MIGGELEQDILEGCLLSDRAEFLVVYGRRREWNVITLEDLYQ